MSIRKKVVPALYEISTPVTVCSLSGVAENVVFTKGSQSARIFKLAHGTWWNCAGTFRM